MSSFSSIFAEKQAEVRSVLGAVRCPSVERLRDLLALSAHQALCLSELAELLEIGAASMADQQLELLRAAVTRRAARALGNRVRYVAPFTFPATASTRAPTAIFPQLASLQSGSGCL